MNLLHPFALASACIAALSLSVTTNAGADEKATEAATKPVEPAAATAPALAAVEVKLKKLTALPKPEEVFVIGVDLLDRRSPVYFTAESLLSALPEFKKGQWEMIDGDDRIWQSGVIVLKDKTVLFWSTCRQNFLKIRSAGYEDVSFIIGDGRARPDFEALDAAKVKTIVREWLVKQGGNPDKVELLTPSREKDGSWRIQLTSLPRTPGAHTILTIDATGKVTGVAGGK